MLCIQKVKAKGFLCYEEVELDFDKDTVTQIIGVNGAGKSSIPTILEEAFYSKNSKGLKKEELVNWNAKGYEIDCYFKIDSAPYHLNVKRGSSLRVTLHENGENISGHTSTQTYKILHELLQLDYQTFTKLVNQNLNSSLQFLTATDTTRKKFLVGLFDLSDYLETEQKMKDQLKIAKANIATLEGTLAAHSKYANSKVPERIELAEVPEIVTIDLDADLEELAETRHQLRISQQNNEAIAKNNEAIKAAERIAASPVLENPYSMPDDLEELEVSYAESVAELKRNRKEYSQYAQVRATCPECGGPMSTADQLDIKKRLEEEEETLSSISNQIFKALELSRKAKKQFETQEASILQFKQKLKLAEAKADWNMPRDITEMSEFQAIIRRKSAEIEKQRDAQNQANKEREVALSFNRSAEVHNARIETLAEAIADAKQQTKEVSDKLNAARLEAADLAALVRAFSTKGLVNFKIESMIKVLETTINDYLVHTSEGKFIIEFSADGDKLNVAVNHLGRKVSVSSLSSGELQKVNVATLLAVRKLMSSFSKSHINVLFFDEVVSTLDDDAKESLIEILMSEHDLNSFVVSHSWTHPLVAKLEINGGKINYVG
jgi:DNA repair exonuclease SbcCD ATPase subunit